MPLKDGMTNRRQSQGGNGGIKEEPDDRRSSPGCLYHALSAP
jgi:hypothetical protein